MQCQCLDMEIFFLFIPQCSLLENFGRCWIVADCLSEQVGISDLLFKNIVINMCALFYNYICNVPMYRLFI